MVSLTFVFCTARAAFKNRIWRSCTLSQEVTAIGTENEWANRWHVGDKTGLLSYKKNKKWHRDASSKEMVWATVKKNVLSESWRNLEPMLSIWLSGGFVSAPALGGAYLAGKSHRRIWANPRSKVQRRNQWFRCHSCHGFICLILLLTTEYLLDAITAWLNQFSE